MATRPSTAAILAAARAADGKRSVVGETSGHGTAVLEPIAEAPTPIVDHPPSETSADAVPARSSSVTNATDPVPTSVAEILRGVRGEREAADGEFRPPAIAEILAKVRAESGESSVVPPSMADLLAQIRAICGTNGTTSPKAAVVAAVGAASAAKRTVPPRKPSTADILAAARKQGAGQPAAGASHPQSASPPATTSRTADILAAARKQGGARPASGDAPEAVSPRPKPAGPPVKVETVFAKPDPSNVAAEFHPPSTTGILEAVRAEAASSSGSLLGETQFPSVVDMVATLRRLDAGRVAAQRGRDEPVGWATKLCRWFTGDRETHRGASI